MAVGVIFPLSYAFLSFFTHFSFFSRFSSFFFHFCILLLKDKGKQQQFTAKMGNFTPTPSAPTPCKTSRWEVWDFTSQLFWGAIHLWNSFSSDFTEKLLANYFLKFPAILWSSGGLWWSGSFIQIINKTHEYFNNFGHDGSGLGQMRKQTESCLPHIDPDCESPLSTALKRRRSVHTPVSLSPSGFSLIAAMVGGRSMVCTQWLAQEKSEKLHKKRRRVSGLWPETGNLEKNIGVHLPQKIGERTDKKKGK